MALISSPYQSADSWAEGSTCKCGFKAKAPPNSSELIESTKHGTACGDVSCRRTRHTAGEHVSVDIFGYSQGAHQQARSHRRLAGAVRPRQHDDRRMGLGHMSTVGVPALTRQMFKI